MEQDFNVLIERVKSGEAKPEETLALLKSLNISFELLKIFLQEIKYEQVRQDILISKN